MKRFVALFALLAVLTACGGGGRPSEDDIADALRDNDDFSSVIDQAEDPDAFVDCLAEAFHDSDLSDDALQALVDGDEDFDASDEDDEAMTDLQDEFGECLTA